MIFVSDLFLIYGLIFISLHMLSKALSRCRNDISASEKPNPRRPSAKFIFPSFGSKLPK